MKNRIIALFIIISVLFSLCSCSGISDIINEEEPVGADWRTWGLVYGGGVVTLGGEEESVLLCISSSGIEVYEDNDAQVLIGMAYYPIEIEDPVSLYTSLEIEDRDGDGTNEITAVFEIDGAVDIFVWKTDGESGNEFVLNEALSDYTSQK